jgi:hypothetical protein
MTTQPPPPIQHHTTVIVNGPAASQALPALVNFMCFPGLGHLIQGRPIGALIWWTLHGISALLCLVGIGFLIWPIVWIACVIDAARYNPNAHQGQSVGTGTLVLIGVVGACICIPLFLFGGLAAIGSLSRSDSAPSAYPVAQVSPEVQSEPVTTTNSPEPQIDLGNTEAPVTITPEIKQPETPAIPEGYVRFPEAIRIGDVEVIPVLARVGEVKLRDLFGDTSTSKDKDNFELRLKVKNHSEVKRLHFRGWPERSSIFKNFSVKDEHDNRYLPLNFGSSTRAFEDQGGDTINPGNEATAVVLFEAPIAAAQTLMVELNGEAVGATGMLKFHLSRADWKPQLAAETPSDPPTESTPPEKAPTAEEIRKRSQAAADEQLRLAKLRIASEERQKAVEEARERQLEEAKWRVWTAREGGFSVDAKFLSLIGGKAKLEKRDGKVITVDLGILIEDDAAFIREKRWLTPE